MFKELIMEIKNIKIQHHNRIVDATVHLPVGRAKFPLIIMSHGYNGHASDFAEYAKYFAKKGIGVVCYTFCGGSTRDESGFLTSQMTLFTEKEDLLAVYEEVKHWEMVDSNGIFLFGGSQGGMVSALAAEELQGAVRGLILKYPAFCIADNWNERFSRQEDIPDTYELWGMELGRIYFESIRDFKIWERIGNYENKVFIMHGTEDEVVPITYAKKAVEHYQNASLEIFEGEGHGFSSTARRKMEEMVVAFVRECMN